VRREPAAHPSRCASSGAPRGLQRRTSTREAHPPRRSPCRSVGEALGLAPRSLRTLAAGGLLHDIGKLAVPDSILKKPAALTDEEYACIRRHPEFGYELLGELGGFSPGVRRLVLGHHERTDGSGYPRGLQGVEIEVETRILSVCDVYDALISTRVYREGWSPDRALLLLHKGAGTEFDRRCVEALEGILSREFERAGSARSAVMPLQAPRRVAGGRADRRSARLDRTRDIHDRGRRTCVTAAASRTRTRGSGRRAAFGRTRRTAPRSRGPRHRSARATRSSSPTTVSSSRRSRA